MQMSKPGFPSIIQHRDQGEILFLNPVSGMSLFGESSEVPGWSAYSAKFGVVENEGEQIIFGTKMFNTSLRSQKTSIPVVFNHDMDKIAGKTLSSSVDIDGLKYEVEAILSDSDSKMIYNRVKSGMLFQNSVGISPPWKITEDKETKLPKFERVFLHHHSIVTKAANPAALVDKVFSALHAYDSALFATRSGLDSQIVSDSNIEHAHSLANLSAAQARIASAINVRKIRSTAERIQYRRIDS